VRIAGVARARCVAHSGWRVLHPDRPDLIRYTREAPALDLFTDSVGLKGDAAACAVMDLDRRDLLSLADGCRQPKA